MLLFAVAVLPNYLDPRWNWLSGIGFGVDPLKRHDAGEALKTGGVER